MAWAEQQRSGRYAGKYRDAGGRTRSVGTFSRKADAERRAAAKEEKVRADPGTVDPREGRVTFRAWCEEWWPTRALEPGTVARDESRLHGHVLPRWGDEALTAIRREDVQAWVLELSSDAHLGAWSVIHCYHLLSSAMRAAVLARKLSSSPCHDVRLPQVPEGDERFLTHEEVDAICRVTAEPYRMLVLLMVGAGLRWGEAAGLHWHRVDLEDGAIDVVEVNDDKVGEIKPYAKGGSATQRRLRRRVWLPDWLVAELVRHRADYPAAGRCAARHRAGSRCRSSLVVPGRGGAPVSYSGFRTRHWAKAVGGPVWRLPDGREYETRSDAAKRKGGDRAVRVWREGLAGVGEATIHDCRHTFASWALQADPPMPIYDLAIAMGHTDTSVTRRYGHLGRASRDRFRRALAWPSPGEFATQTPRGDDDEVGAMIGSPDRFGRSDG